MGGAPSVPPWLDGLEHRHTVRVRSKYTPQEGRVVCGHRLKAPQTGASDGDWRGAIRLAHHSPRTLSKRPRRCSARCRPRRLGVACKSLNRPRRWRGLGGSLADLLLCWNGRACHRGRTGLLSAPASESRGQRPVSRKVGRLVELRLRCEVPIWQER
jgi:hypothetical protein